MPGCAPTAAFAMQFFMEIISGGQTQACRLRSGTPSTASRRKPTFRWLPDLAVLLPLGGTVNLRGIGLCGRHPNRLQPGMCTARARFHPVKIRADIVPRQVQHLAPELPIFLDLRLGLRRSPSELAVSVACRRDPL